MQDKPTSREQLSWVENRSWENSGAKDGDQRVFPQRAVETGRRGKRDNTWRRLLGSALEWGQEMTRYLDEVRAKGVLVLSALLVFGKEMHVAAAAWMLVIPEARHWLGLLILPALLEHFC